MPLREEGAQDSLGAGEEVRDGDRDWLRDFFHGSGRGRGTGEGSSLPSILRGDPYPQG